MLQDFSRLTTLDSSGSIDYTDITSFGFVYIKATTNTGVKIFKIARLQSHNTPLVMTYDNVTPRNIARSAMVEGYNGGMSSSQGIGQDTINLPVQIGDGTNLTNFIGQASSLEYARPTNFKKLEANDFSVVVKASASDDMDFRQCIFATEREQNFTIDPASSTSATYRFDSFILRRYNVTWLTGVTCDGATFIACPEIDAKGGIFNNCSIISPNVGATEAAISFNANSSMTGTKVDVTGTSAGYHIELGTAVTAFTLADVTFTGTPGTDKIHVLATTGTVTITTTGTTSLAASDITTEGATVVIASSPITVTVTVVDGAGDPIEGARVYLVEFGTSNVILNTLTNASGIATTTFSGTAPQAVAGWVRKGTSAPLYKEFMLGGTITTAGYDNTAIMTLDT